MFDINLILLSTLLDTITEINFYLFNTVSIDIQFKFKLTVMLSTKKIFSCKTF